MKAGELMKALSAALTENRHRLVVTQTVKTVYFDPTYGQQEYSEKIETVDFNALCAVIDEFGKELSDEAETEAKSKPKTTRRA